MRIPKSRSKGPSGPKRNEIETHGCGPQDVAAEPNGEQLLAAGLHHWPGLSDEPPEDADEPDGMHWSNPATRMRVRMWSGLGTPPAAIARMLGISRATLDRTYGNIMKGAEDELIAAIASTVVGKALQGDLDAAKFILTRKGAAWGWGTTPPADDGSDKRIVVEHDVAKSLTILFDRLRGGELIDAPAQPVQTGREPMSHQHLLADAARSTEPDA